MAINFPDNRDQLVPPQPSGPIQTGDVYVYLGTTYTATVLSDSSVRWDAAVSAGSDAYVLKVGDTMTGQLTLPGGGTGSNAATVDQITSAIPAALWQRDGGTSTLSPATADDNLNQGTGDISGGNIQASGFTNALGGSYSRTGDTNNKLFIGQQTDFTEVFSVSNTGNVVAAGDVQTTSLNSGPLAGFRNALVNGDFRVWQRGTPVTVSDPSGVGYGPDRWRATGNGTTMTRGTGLGAGYPSAFGVRVNSSGGGGCSIAQPIELPQAGHRGPFAEGSEWTVSAYFEDPATASFQVLFATGSIGPGESWTGGALTTHDTINGKTRVSQTFTSPASIDGARTSCLVVLQDSVNNRVFCQAQFEPGSVATPFEARPIGTELALCQRYYQAVPFLYLAKINAAGSDIGVTSARSVTMRTTPTESGDVSRLTGAAFVGDEKIWRVTAAGYNGTSTGSANNVTADAEL